MDFVLAKYAGQIFDMGEHEKRAAVAQSASVSVRSRPATRYESSSRQDDESRLTADSLASPPSGWAGLTGDCFAAGS